MKVKWKWGTYNVEYKPSWIRKLDSGMVQRIIYSSSRMYTTSSNRKWNGCWTIKVWTIWYWGKRKLNSL